MIEYLFLGMTIGQPRWFYGGPWAAALIGATRTPGVILSQACTTSTTCIFQAAVGIETGLYQNSFCLMTDRCSNGPHTIWPNPGGPGGQVVAENWMMDNFNQDPWADSAMIQTAENVAREAGIDRRQCDAVALRRYEQYLDAAADSGAFKQRYLFPVEVNISRRKTVWVEDDEGVTPCTAEGLAGLRPVLPDGVITFGAQTHPADGHSAVLVTTREKAGELSSDPNIDIRIVSYGYARAKKGYMAMAVVPAAQMALEKAGIGIGDVSAVKTHNPFAVNDVYFAREMGLDVNDFNNFGSSLVFGHPQAPTAARLIIEGIEEVVMRGGGYLLWAGCAAGDTGAGMVLKIGK